MTNAEKARCGRCQDTLINNSTYCLSCGYDNGDAQAKQVGLVQHANERIERAKIMGKFFRFCRFLGWARFFR